MPVPHPPKMKANGSGVDGKAVTFGDTGSVQGGGRRSGLSHVQHVQMESKKPRLASGCFD